MSEDRRTYSEKIKDPRWQKKRLEILSRDNWRCLVCGNTERTLHVHHVVYEGEPWEARSDLLYTVCVDCHGPEHDEHRDALANILVILGRCGVRSSIDLMQLAMSTQQAASALPGGEKGPPFTPQVVLQAFAEALSSFESWRTACGEDWFAR